MNLKSDGNILSLIPRGIRRHREYEGWLIFQCGIDRHHVLSNFGMFCEIEGWKKPTESYISLNDVLHYKCWCCPVFWAFLTDKQEIDRIYGNCRPLKSALDILRLQQLHPIQRYTMTEGCFKLKIHLLFSRKKVSHDKDLFNFSKKKVLFKITMRVLTL